MILWLRSGPATGSAIAEEGFHYVYREIKDDVQLATISGANELNGCIALGNPFGPVYPGELSVSRSRDEGRGHSLHHQHEESGAGGQKRHPSEPVRNMEALAYPEILDLNKDLPEMRSQKQK